MISRYEAPFALKVFSDQARMERWTTITKLYAKSYIHDKDLLEKLEAAPVPAFDMVQRTERYTGHDAVAFLTEFTRDLAPGLLSYVHRGLTSSDIVDNAHFAALHEHALEMNVLLRALREKLVKWDKETYPRPGRTHGQLAYPTTWQHQMRVHHDTLSNIIMGLDGYSMSCPVKSPGPVGSSVDLFRRSTNLADNDTSFGVMVLSTQIIPRDYQLTWAGIYLRIAVACENLALLVRTGSRAEIGEIREGRSKFRVGSSAMPHKANPITSEQVCGLARVARGYFSAIAESASLWDDRDMSNSSVERTVVPDLAHITEHMIHAMITVMMELEVDKQQMRKNVGDPRLYTGLMQSLLQEVVLCGPIEASDLIRKAIAGVADPNRWLSCVLSAIQVTYGFEHAELVEAGFSIRKNQMFK